LSTVQRGGEIGIHIKKASYPGPRLSRGAEEASIKSLTTFEIKPKSTYTSGSVYTSRILPYSHIGLKDYTFLKYKRGCRNYSLAMSHNRS
jgi:hypothetical protein